MMGSGQLSLEGLQRSHLLRNLRWVRGVPTSLNTVASVRPGKNASTLFTRAVATSSFFRSYSGALRVCRTAVSQSVHRWCEPLRGSMRGQATAPAQIVPMGRGLPLDAQQQCL